MQILVENIVALLIPQSMWEGPCRKQNEAMRVARRDLMRRKKYGSLEPSISTNMPASFAPSNSTPSNIYTKFGFKEGSSSHKKERTSPSVKSILQLSPPQIPVEIHHVQPTFKEIFAPEKIEKEGKGYIAIEMKEIEKLEMKEKVFAPLATFNSSLTESIQSSASNKDEK